MILEVLLAAVSAGVLVVLIAWGASCTRCTALRELPDRPIPMEHEHGGGEGNGSGVELPQKVKAGNEH